MSEAYQILGVSPDAGPDEIKHAFRQLAKRHHPDAPDSDDAAFKRITLAYAVLSDASKRALYDRGEIGIDGVRRRPELNAKMEAAARRAAANRAVVDEVAVRAEAYFRSRIVDLDDHADVDPADLIRPDADGVHRVPLPLEEAAKGASRHLLMGGGAIVELSVPLGVRDGQRFRIRGQPGVREAEVEVQIQPHPIFRRVGVDLHVDVPVSLYEAVIGGKIPAPTLEGPVTVTLPKDFDGARVLRIRGRGLPKPDGEKGDLLVRPRITLPPQESKGSSELRKFVLKWSRKAPYDARAGRRNGVEG